MSGAMKEALAGRLARQQEEVEWHRNNVARCEAQTKEARDGLEVAVRRAAETDAELKALG